MKLLLLAATVLLPGAAQAQAFVVELSPETQCGVATSMNLPLIKPLLATWMGMDQMTAAVVRQDAQAGIHDKLMPGTVFPETAKLMTMPYLQQAQAMCEQNPDWAIGLVAETLYNNQPWTTQFDDAH